MTTTGSSTEDQSLQENIRKPMKEDFLVPLKHPCVYYIPNLLASSDAASIYDELHTSIPWEKTAKINRWVALYEEDPTSGYRYRDAPQPETNEGVPLRLSSIPSLARIKALCEQEYQQQTQESVTFNTCLLNFYEDGQQRIGWHADREEIGRTTPIASVSLGATRQFLLRHKLHGATDRASLALESGSVVFMENLCQMEYLHSVPKESDVTEGRINLTFRCKQPGEHTAGEELHDRRDKWLERVLDDNNTNNHHASSTNTTQEMCDESQGMPLPQLFGDDIRLGTTTDEPTAYGKVQYTLSCNIGIECQLGAEAVERLGGSLWKAVARPWGVAGYVAVILQENTNQSVVDDDSNNNNISAILSAAAEQLLELRAAHNVMQYHDHFTLQQVLKNDSVTEGKIEKVNQIDGDMLYAFFKQRLQSNPKVISTLHSDEKEPATVTFRVTADRIGDQHAFRTPEVAYEMGGACQEFYEHSKPKMTDYDVNIRIDVVVDHIIVGTQLNVEDLSKRHFLRYRNSVTVKSSVAYTMLRLANVQRGDWVVDPFCGSGTILLEACEMTDKQIKCTGLDVSKRCIAGTKQNALAEGCGPDICEFHCSDARGMRRYVVVETSEDGHQSTGRMVDAIVSNLPWGVRTGQNQSNSELQQLYETFLRISWYILKPKGRIVMLVLRGLQLVRILRKLSGRYRILKVMIVRTTNNMPSIVVVEKLERDRLHDSVKLQLSYMSQFVNFSKEMYQNITTETIDD